VLVLPSSCSWRSSLSGSMHLDDVAGSLDCWHLSSSPLSREATLATRGAAGRDHRSAFYSDELGRSGSLCTRPMLRDVAKRDDRATAVRESNWSG
jgi:hypothetical protein